MTTGYLLVDCTGIDLTSDTEVTVTGIWNKAVTALKQNKPIIAHNCVYGTGVKVSPITCFGRYISTTEIVIVGATLHIHIKNTDKVTILDVAAS